MAARKKKTSSSKAVALSWKQQLQKHVKEGKAPKEKPPTSDFISIAGNKFTLGGEKIGLEGKGLELDCVVVGWCFEKTYYDGPFDKKNPIPPACFALTYNEDDFAPHEVCPAKQADTCDDCWANEWGSGSGEGKACADRRRLALAVEDTDGKMAIKMLSIPPTSLKNWKSFINDIEGQELHPMQVAARISFDEDSTAQALPLVFEFVNEITSEKTLEALAATLDKAEKMLDQPFDVSNYVPPNKRGGASKKKTSKKKTAKKKTARRSKFS